MKNLMKLGMALLITAMVLGFGGCFEPEADDGKKSDTLDFTNYKGQDAAIFVENQTTRPLVAFKGSPSQNIILGGIPAGPSGGSHGIGLAKNRATFPADTSVDFAMVLVDQEAYEANKSNLSMFDQSPFTRVYVFYNSQGDNNVIYRISSSLGGTKHIRLTNTSGYNVELREDGIDGRTLGYAPMNMSVVNLYVEEKDYNVYPVFKYYNVARNTIGTIHPRGDSGKYWLWTFSGRGAGMLSLNTTSVESALTAGKTLGAAWMIVSNDATQGLEVATGNGLTPIQDTMGFTYFNPGDEKTIQINMMSAGGTAYSTSRQVSGYDVGNIAARTPIRDENGQTSFTLQSDYQYPVYITGDPNASQTGPDRLQAIINISEGQAIDFNAFMAQ